MKTVRSRRYLKEKWNIDLDQIAYDYVIYFLEIVHAFSSDDLKDPAFERSAYETIPEWGVQDGHLKKVTTSDTRLAYRATKRLIREWDEIFLGSVAEGHLSRKVH
jgi:hypothetical protein